LPLLQTHAAAHHRSNRRKSDAPHRVNDPDRLVDGYVIAKQDVITPSLTEAGDITARWRAFSPRGPPAAEKKRPAPEVRAKPSRGTSARTLCHDKANASSG
jgi:hypothetical protein